MINHCLLINLLIQINKKLPLEKKAKAKVGEVKAVKAVSMLILQLNLNHQPHQIKRLPTD